MRQCPEEHRGRRKKNRASTPAPFTPLASPPFHSPTMLLTCMKPAATHVSDQVQPASSVSKLQAPGKPTESTFIAGDPVTECVIHYSLICSPDHPLPRHPQPPTLPCAPASRPWGDSAAQSNLSLCTLVFVTSFSCLPAAADGPAGI